MTRTVCRVCGESAFEPVIDLGHQYLSDFRKTSEFPEKWPLEVVRCSRCNLIQLSKSTPRSLMYHGGYGYRSGTNEILRQNLERIVSKILTMGENPRNWLDIASNDGTLLSYLPKNIQRFGIDPVKKFKIEAEQHADVIIDDYYPNELLSNLRFDVISSIFMFYDVDDVYEFVASIKGNLSESGVWIVQQNYLGSMIESVTFDNISHEHLTYFSLHSFEEALKPHGLEVFDCSLSPINGGSLVTLVGHQGRRKIENSVATLRESELKLELRHQKTYDQFAQRVEEVTSTLKQLITELHEQNKKIHIYGASTRGATIWQTSKIDHSLIDYAVERQTEKIGKYFSAIGVKIISESQMRELNPDYLLVGPWFLKDYFVDREKFYLHNGGKMIFPLPTPSIYAFSDS